MIDIAGEFFTVGSRVSFKWDKLPAVGLVIGSHGSNQVIVLVNDEVHIIKCINVRKIPQDAVLR